MSRFAERFPLEQGQVDGLVEIMAFMEEGMQ